MFDENQKLANQSQDLADENQRLANQNQTSATETQNLIDLLRNIVRSFPEINNQAVNVVIITNAPPPSRGYNTQPQRNIDYNRAFQQVRRNYNQYLGVKLADAKRLFMRQEYSLVLRMMHNLEEQEPYNTRIKNIIGSTYYKIGFYEFAEKYWRESLSLDPNQPLVELYLARVSRDYYGSEVYDTGGYDPGIYSPPPSRIPNQILDEQDNNFPF